MVETGIALRVKRRLGPAQRCRYCRRILPRDSHGDPVGYDYLEYVVDAGCARMQGARLVEDRGALRQLTLPM